jgi:hypothetical protein
MVPHDFSQTIQCSSLKIVASTFRQIFLAGGGIQCELVADPHLISFEVLKQCKKIPCPFIASFRASHICQHETTKVSILERKTLGQEIKVPWSDVRKGLSELKR